MASKGGQWREGVVDGGGGGGGLVLSRRLTWRLRIGNGWLIQIRSVSYVAGAHSASHHTSFGRRVMRRCSPVAT